MDDTIILWLVIAARFLVPLAIPRYPLPGILVALILDAADQTIFQTFTTLPLDNYQNYDKALDIYYLTIAYLSTLRNWGNEFAFRLSRFLFYYRLVGVLLFEFSGFRPLLLFFPNVFEYFFIFYETVRLRYDPVRLRPVTLLGVAAGLWVFVKVPQEYWIHIAQRDVTDTIGELLAAAPGTPWEGVLRLWPLGLVGALLAVLAGLVVIARRLPERDYSWRLDANLSRPVYTSQQLGRAQFLWAERIFDRDLLEKAFLITLISLIFSQILPGIDARPLLFTLDIILFVIANTFASHWFSRRGVTWGNVATQFLAMLLVNSVGVAAYILLVVRARGTGLLAALFFTLLLTVLITLYDRFQQEHLARFPAAWSNVEMPRRRR